MTASVILSDILLSPERSEGSLQYNIKIALHYFVQGDFDKEVVYQPDDITRLEVRVEGESVWLTQAQMSDLFQKDQSVIARHIKNVFREDELEQASNMQILHNTLSKLSIALMS